MAEYPLTANKNRPWLKASQYQHQRQSKNKEFQIQPDSRMYRLQTDFKDNPRPTW